MILDAMTEAQTSTFPQSTPASSTDQLPPNKYPTLTSEHLKLKMRLSPLQQVEEALLRRLAPPGSPDFEATHLASLTNLPYSVRSANGSHEVAVNSLTPWKNAFNRLMPPTARLSVETQDIDFEDPNDPGVVLQACSEDMITLWSDPTVKELLQVRRLRLQDMAGL